MMARSPSIQQKIFFSVVLATIGASAVWSWSIATRLSHHEMWGDRSDIALVRALRELPSTASIVVADSKTALEWFANPNIQYYARRTLMRYTLDHVPRASYQIVPAHFGDNVVADLASGKAYGTRIAAKKLRCSTHFCLISMEK